MHLTNIVDKGRKMFRQDKMCPWFFIANKHSFYFFFYPSWFLCKEEFFFAFYQHDKEASKLGIGFVIGKK